MALYPRSVALYPNPEAPIPRSVAPFPRSVAPFPPTVAPFLALWLRSSSSCALWLYTYILALWLSISFAQTSSIGYSSIVSPQGHHYLCAIFFFLKLPGAIHCHTRKSIPTRTNLKWSCGGSLVANQTFFGAEDTGLNPTYPRKILGALQDLCEILTRNTHH